MCLYWFDTYIRYKSEIKFVILQPCQLFPIKHVSPDHPHCVISSWRWISCTSGCYYNKYSAVVRSELQKIQEDKWTIKRFIFPQASITEKGTVFNLQPWMQQSSKDDLKFKTKMCFVESRLCPFRYSRIICRGNALFSWQKMALLLERNPPVRMNGAIFISFYQERRVVGK